MNVNVTFSVDPQVMREFDLWLKLNKFKTRSEAIVYLMRQAMPERKDEMTSTEPSIGQASQSLLVAAYTAERKLKELGEHDVANELAHAATTMVEAMYAFYKETRGIR